MTEDPRQIWPNEEYKRAVQLLDRGYDRRVVAIMLGRTLRQLNDKLHYELMTQPARLQRLERAKALRHQPAVSNKMNHLVRSFEKAPGCVFEERRQRQAAQYRDLTAEFCGDPRPGYSAADRRERDE